MGKKQTDPNCETCRQRPACNIFGSFVQAASRVLGQAHQIDGFEANASLNVSACPMYVEGEPPKIRQPEA